MNDTPNLLTAKQAATELGVTVRTISRWARPGGPLQATYTHPSERGTRYFSPADVSQLKALRERQPAA